MSSRIEQTITIVSMTGWLLVENVFILFVILYMSTKHTWSSDLLKTKHYFRIFGTIVKTMKNLIIPLDRAHRVLLGKSSRMDRCYLYLRIWIIIQSVEYNFTIIIHCWQINRLLLKYGMSGTQSFDFNYIESYWIISNSFLE